MFHVSSVVQSHVSCLDLSFKLFASKLDVVIQPSKLTFLPLTVQVWSPVKNISH